MTKGDILRAMDYLGHIVEAIDRIDRYAGSTCGANRRRHGRPHALE